MGIIVAWGGKSCDIKWMWKIIEEAHVGECIMPKNCKFFLDPIDTIEQYKRCPLITPLFLSMVLQLFGGI